MGPRLMVLPVEASDGNQSEIGHQLVRAFEPREVADLGQEGRRRDQVNATHGHQCVWPPLPATIRHRAANRMLEPIEALLRLTIANIISSNAMRCSG